MYMEGDHTETLIYGLILCYMQTPDMHPSSLQTTFCNSIAAADIYVLVSYNDGSSLPPSLCASYYAGHMTNKSRVHACMYVQR